MSADLAAHIGTVARHLLGEPNRALSSRTQWRYGSPGAVCIEIGGTKRGTWFDHSEGTGGGVLDLVVRERGGTRGDAFTWLRDQQLVYDASAASARSHDETDHKERSYGETAPASVQQATLAPWACGLWESCRPITPADAAGRYLLARGCALPHQNGDLRQHPALRHPSGHVGPALVGLITEIGDPGQWLNLHRTWITSNGSGGKADVEPPRLVLKDHRKGGGVVPLWPDDVVTLGLGLAEGVETALTLARVFVPAWAAIDAGNLAGFRVLLGIESITVCVDHDPAGLRAHDALAARWTAAGRELRKVLAPTPGDDLNDWNQRA